MTETHEVISAFLDNEPFDAADLVRALSDPDGRELLIDVIALRHLAQPDKAVPVATLETPRYSGGRRFAVAAAVLLALAGGYVLGDRQGDDTNAAAPAPTRVVQAPAAWDEIPPGRMQ